MSKRNFLVLLMIGILVCFAILAGYIYQVDQGSPLKDVTSNNQDGKALFQAKKSWRNIPIAPTADISIFKETIREGVKIFVVTPDGNKLLLAIQGKIIEVDEEKKYLKLGFNDAFEKIDFKDIDRVILKKTPSVSASKEITQDQIRVYKGNTAAYNPVRFDGGISALYIIQ